MALPLRQSIKGGVPGINFDPKRQELNSNHAQSLQGSTKITCRHNFWRAHSRVCKVQALPNKKKKFLRGENYLLVVMESPTSDHSSSSSALEVITTSSND